jgi:hypothetical protein
VNSTLKSRPNRGLTCQMASRGAFHQNAETVKRRNTIQFDLLMGGTRRASSLPGRCCSFLRAWPAPVHCNFEASRSAAPRCLREGCASSIISALAGSLRLLSGSTFFSAFREDHLHVHAHDYDYDHNHQSPPPPRLLALSKSTTRDT